MLPRKTLKTILEEVPTEIHFPLSDSTAQETGQDRGSFPFETEWPWTEPFETPPDVEDPDSSTYDYYDHVQLMQKTVGVVENNQPIDEYFGETVINNNDVDVADIAVAEGQYVYDILEFRVSSFDPRPIDVNGDGTTDVTLDQSERARMICGYLVEHFLHEWNTRPGVPFDHEGNVRGTFGNPDDPDDEVLNYPHNVYADEMKPVPVIIRPLVGRGPMNVTEMVDANGAQYNAAVKLGYVDSVVEYGYVADDGDIVIEIDPPGEKGGGSGL